MTILGHPLRSSGQLLHITSDPVVETSENFMIIRSSYLAIWKSWYPLQFAFFASIAAKAHFQFHGAPASQVRCPVFQPSSCCQIRRSGPAWVSRPMLGSPSCYYCWLNFASGLERRCRSLTDQHQKDPDSHVESRPSYLVIVFILKARNSMENALMKSYPSSKHGILASFANTFDVACRSQRDQQVVSFQKEC